MRHAGRLDHLNLLEPRSRVAEIVEESGPVSEEDGDDGEQHLVEQPRRQVLLHDPGTSAEGHVPAGGGFLRQLERWLDPIGDEVKSRAALHLQWLAGVMGEYEDRVVVRGVFAPEARPRVSSPRPWATPEHVATHHGRADVLEPAPTTGVLVPSRVTSCATVA